MVHQCMRTGSGCKLQLCAPLAAATARMNVGAPVQHEPSDRRPLASSGSSSSNKQLKVNAPSVVNLLSTAFCQAPRYPTLRGGCAAQMPIDSVPCPPQVYVNPGESGESVGSYYPRHSGPVLTTVDHSEQAALC